ncbi:MAG: tetratricopeptide repeat protein [Bacteroidota bacterium]|nr:tetratricopeptide repeat protein [Bacteroidota bacterium]
MAVQPKILCGKCGNPIRLHDRYCARCGTEAEWGEPVEGREGETGGSRTSPGQATQSGRESIVCASCGVPNPASSEVCSACGSPLRRKGKDVEHLQDVRHLPKNKKAKLFSLKLEPWHWLAIAAAALIIIVVVIGELRNTPKEVPSESSSNSASLSPTMLADIESLQKSVDANPDDTQSMLRLANMLQDAQFYPRAIEMYKKYLAKKPDDPNARVDMGICYLESGDAPTAKKEMETALKYDPKHQMAMFNLGIVSLKMGDVQKSNEWLRKAINVDSTTTIAQRAKDILAQHSLIQ